jgi:hypothetical protein
MAWSNMKRREGGREQQPPPDFSMPAADEEDDDPHTLPSKDVWIHSGNMSKKIVSNQGVKFQTRFAVLTPDSLFFTKLYDSTYIPKIAFVTDEAQLEAVFKQYDKDESG